MLKVCLALLCVSVLANPSFADEPFDATLFASETEADAAAFAITPPSPQITKNKYNLNKVVSKPQSIVPESASNAQKSPLKLMDNEDLNFPENDASEEDFEVHDEPKILPKIQTPQNQTSSLPKKSSLSSSDETSTSAIDPSQGLVDAIADKDVQGKINLPSKESSTWIGKITEKASEISKESDKSSSDSLSELMKPSSQKNKRSNASVFDISGLMLRMSKQQIEQTMQNRGFQKVHEKFEIPNFIRWRNEEKCRAHGVVGYERLMNCVAETAQKNGHKYTQLLKFSKFDTKEHISVYFTSNFTNNKVYKIIYKSMSQTITGNSAKAIYLRNVKIYDFWKKVNQKYGAPDNKDEVIWGLGGNKPYMQASSGYLVLEDPMLRELDYTRMSREDQRYMNTDLYNF